MRGWSFGWSRPPGASHPGAGTPPDGPTTERSVSRDRWTGLRALIVTRLVVAALALPAGVLWWPDAGDEARGLMTAALLTIGVSSALLWLLVDLRRGYRAQVGLQLGVDILLVTGLASVTGGRESQFVLFYVLIAVAGGIHAGLRGGVVTALAACAGYAALPFLSRSNGMTLPSGPGEVFPNPAILVVLLGAVGALAGVLGRRTDRARADLARTTRELDRMRFDHDVILRNLSSGVLTVDADGRLAYLNPTAEEVLDLSGADVLGRSVNDALPARLALLRDVLLTALERHETRLRSELRLMGGSGAPLPIGISTNLLAHEGRVTGVVAVFQDLSEVRNMEERARRNQTLAELGALAAGIAHELRNGLKPISGSAEILTRELRLEGEQAQLMELIITESVRLNRFVTDLLNYSRDRAVVKQPVDLTECLGELVDQVRRDARCDGITVGFEPDPQYDLIVPADREQLRQVWLNLSNNALEALGSRGTLTVRTRLEEPTSAVVEFEDDGTGIAAEDLPRVGQPFFTTKRGGTGLGLAIAMRIVERHGGSLVLDSTPGRGTVARVTLPDAVGAMAQAA
jgi:two-component system, NtrC family, sensor histidine kinase PilS